MRFKHLLLILSLIVSAGAVGMLPVAEVHAQTPPPPGVYIQSAPPAEIVEEVPAQPPGERWVWQKGHWRWQNGGYVWRAGHWVERPYHGARWIPPHWSQGPAGGWHFIEGHWQ